MKAEEKTAEDVFNAQAKKEWLEGASFSSPVGSLNSIPFVVYPAVFKVMEEYAQSRTEALQEELYEVRSSKALIQSENAQLKQENERLRNVLTQEYRAFLDF